MFFFSLTPLRHSKRLGASTPSLPFQLHKGFVVRNCNSIRDKMFMSFAHIDSSSFDFLYSLMMGKGSASCLELAQLKFITAREKNCQIISRIPVLKYNMFVLCEYLAKNAKDRKAHMKRMMRIQGQFKSPGQGPRGQFGRQSFHASQGYTYPQGGYSGMSGHGMERRMSSAGSEGDSFLQGGGDESYDYQHLASDDSRDTQQGASEHGQIQSGFHGVFGNGSGQQEGHLEQPQPSGTSETAVSGTGPSPPDIKVEVTPYPFMKTNDFELIEIDPDDEDDI
ncbi:interleukin enhancer-binding factor 3 isoform X9 [Biomphalaria glabrata]|nr:interleukin enhancer-binding factor 3 isoform X9 [Biomphalaria glabrata]